MDITCPTVTNGTPCAGASFTEQGHEDYQQPQDLNPDGTVKSAAKMVRRTVYLCATCGNGFDVKEDA